MNLCTYGVADSGYTDREAIGAAARFIQSFFGGELEMRLAAWDYGIEGHWRAVAMQLEQIAKGRE